MPQTSSPAFSIDRPTSVDDDTPLNVMDVGNHDAVKGVFETHHKEIQRRAEVLRDQQSATVDGESGMFFSRCEKGGTDLPFEIPDQKWAVYSISHVNMAPVCVDPQQPAIRIYGCFADRVDAIEHAELVKEDDPTCSLLIGETHKWILAGKSVDRVRDTYVCEEKIQGLLAKHKEDNEVRRNNFQSHVQKSKACADAGQVPRLQDKQANGEIPTDDDLDAKEVLEELKKNQAETFKRGKERASKRMSNRVMLCGQSVACVSFLLEDSSAEDNPEPEFAFRIYGCVENEAIADQWIKNVISREVVDHDIYSVLMYKWLFPFQAILDKGNAIRSCFRNKELHTIMESQKVQPEEVKKFEKKLLLESAHDEQTGVQV